MSWAGPSHMLNSCDIRENIAIYRWFYRIGNVHSHCQQEAEKRDEQAVERYKDVNVSSTKTSSCSRLKISLHGSKQVTEYGSYLGEMIIMDSGNTINLFVNQTQSQRDQNCICP